MTQAERVDFSRKIRSKYQDVFKVNSGCNKFCIDPDNFSDEVNVKGRLHLPSSIEFFREIGASKFVLNILKEGHHPKLKEPVPDFEFRNNASYFKHQDFAESQEFDS